MSPRHHGIWGMGWGRCDRCGFEHPLLHLTPQKSLLLCRCHGCLDDLTVDKRDSVIQDILSGGEGEMEDQRTLIDTSTTGELEF